MPKHVLIVDDNDASAELRAELITEQSGGAFIAEPIYGGQECLERLKRGPAVDFIVLDIEMPGVNGVDVIRNVIDRDPLPALKIIPYTASGDLWRRKTEVQDLLQKPAFKKLVTETFERGEGDIIGGLIEMFKQSTPA